MSFLNAMENVFDKNRSICYEPHQQYMWRSYDEDLFNFFFNVKHEQDGRNTVCWYREGVLYSGIAFAFAIPSWGSNEAVCWRKEYVFSLWKYSGDIISTHYFKLRHWNNYYLVFVRDNGVFYNTETVLGSERADSLYETAFNRAVCDTTLNVIDVIQCVLRHTRVLISPRFVVLARLARNTNNK
jgi:hypothetical protein